MRRASLGWWGVRDGIREERWGSPGLKEGTQDESFPFAQKTVYRLFADLKKQCAVAYDAGDAQHPEKGSLGGSHQRRGRFVQREVPHPLTPVTDLSHLQLPEWGQKWGEGTGKADSKESSKKGLEVGGDQ